MACHHLSDHRPQCCAGLRHSLKAESQKMACCSAHIMAGSLTLRVPAPVCPRLRAPSRPTRLQLTPEPVPLYIQARSVCSLYSQSCKTNTYSSYPCHKRVCRHTHTHTCEVHRCLPAHDFTSAANLQAALHGADDGQVVQ